MKRKITIKGAIGLLIGLAGLIYLLTAHAGLPTPAASAAPANTIDVEQAVSFPYDI